MLVKNNLWAYNTQEVIQFLDAEQNAILNTIIRHVVYI